MTIKFIYQNWLVFLQTVFLSKYTDPDKYQHCVVSVGREKLASEVADVVSSQLIKSVPVLKVLDVAAGTGLISKALAKKGFKVTAFDHVGEMLKLLARKNINIDTKIGDMNLTWPFGDNSFQAVTIVWGNRYITNPQNFASQAHRVLKDGGVFVWPIFAVELPLWWMFRLRNAQLSNIFSLTEILPNGIMNILQSAGFASVAIYKIKNKRKIGLWQRPMYIVARK